MLWSYNVKWCKTHFKLKKFNFSLSFLLAFAYSFFLGNGYLFLLYTIAIVLHELMHILVAKKLGYTLSNFTLSITGASMKLENESFFSMDEILIAVSGPFFNLLVFICLACGWWIFPTSYSYTFDFALVNLFVFALNILPIYSLDGGRIVVAIVGKYFDRKTGIKIVRCIGFFVSISMFILFIISCFNVFNFSLGVMSVFLFISAMFSGKTEYKKINIISKAEKLKNNLSMDCKFFIFSDDAMLIHLYRKLKSETFSMFVIYNKISNKNNENSTLIYFDEDKLLKLIEKFGFATKIANIKDLYL